MRPEWLKLLNGTEEDGEPVDLLLDGMVGGRITAEGFSAYLNTLKKDKKVRLFLNSFGGYVDQGTTIYNVAKVRGNVDTVVAGYAASIMSVIAQAGDTRCMMPGSMMVIHNPTLPTGGGEEKDLEMQLEHARKIKSNIIDIYHDSTGLSRKKLSEMMDKTTVMTAKEAVDFGFADEIFDTSKMKNKIEVSPTDSLASVLRSANSVELTEKDKRAEQNQNQNKPMKLLTAALAAAGLLPSADMTDEATIVTAVNKNLPTFTNSVDKQKIVDLEAKVTKFETANKTRIAAKVKNAIEVEKLVKPERQEFLTNMGVTNELDLDNYLEDLRAVKPANNAPAPKVGRGAPPVPPENQTPAQKKDEQIVALQNELKECKDGGRRVEISRELRDLRGHNSLFAEEARK